VRPKNSKHVLMASVGMTVLAAFIPASTFAQSGPSYVQQSLSGVRDQPQPDRAAVLSAKLKKIVKTAPKAPVPNVKMDPNFEVQLQNFNSNLAVLQDQVDALPEQPEESTNSPKSQHDNGSQNSGKQSQQTSNTPPIPSSDNNFLDDVLKWNMPVYIYPSGSNGIDVASTYCLPANVKVMGLDSKFTQAKKTGSDTTINYLPVRLDDSRFEGKALNAQLQNQTDPVRRCDNIPATAVDIKLGQPDLTKGLAIYDDTQFFVSEADLNHAASRSGWDYGALVVPFKFQMSDESTVVGSASLGGYLGYRCPLNLIGFRFTPMIFLGVSEVPSPQTDAAGKTTTQTLAGLSYGIGFIAKIKDDFNVGLVFGADHVNAGQSYQYQDKPWVSLSLGYSLTSLTQ